MLRIIAAACTLCWATFATAQTPAPEDGIGPYDFGMSVDSARATAPNASWALTQQGRTRVLSGGPPVIIGERLEASLTFVADRLHSIALSGAMDLSCIAAVGGMVETLEPLYGVFTSMAPHAVEAGVLSAVHYSELGSEVRWREVPGSASFAVSARYGRMNIIVRGVQQGSGCALTVTLSPPGPSWLRQDASSGPSWAELDAARSWPRPEFARRPAGDSVLRAYPLRALESGMSGLVVLDCLVTERLRLNCRTTEETPGDQGFAAAAREVMHEYRVRAQDAPSVVGKRVRIPFNFRVEN